MKYYITKSIFDMSFFYFRNFDGKFIIDRNGVPHLAGRDLEADILKYLSEEVEL